MLIVTHEKQQFQLYFLILINVIFVSYNEYYNFTSDLYVLNEYLAAGL